jgi:hypothetical protein
MKLDEWAQGDKYDTLWERGGFAGFGVRAELPDKGSFRVDEPLPEPQYTRRAIQAPNGAVIADDGSERFDTAWTWCAVPLPEGTHYGHVWNPEPTGLGDLSIPFVDDPVAPNQTRYNGKSFKEWAESAELQGDESDFEKRLAWAKAERSVERKADDKGQASARRPV